MRSFDSFEQNQEPDILEINIYVNKGIREDMVLNRTVIVCEDPLNP